MTHTHRSIHFCPHCGTPVQSQLRHGEYRPTCPSCGWIYFPDPKVAAAVLVRKDGQVLLTQRSYEPDQGKWALPAGFMNAFEDPEKAACRECLEETGLEVAVTGLLTVVSGREHPEGADMVLVYEGQVTGGTLKAGDDAADARFFNLEKLPPLAFRATRIVLGKE